MIYPVDSVIHFLNNRGQLYILLSFESVRALEIHDVARHVMYSVRTRDAQWQWAQTSLRMKARTEYKNRYVMRTCVSYLEIQRPRTGSTEPC